MIAALVEVERAHVQAGTAITQVPACFMEAGFSAVLR